MQKKYLIAGAVGFGALVGTIHYEKSSPEKARPSYNVPEIYASAGHVEKTQKAIRRRVRLEALPPLRANGPTATTDFTRVQEFDRAAEVAAITEIGESIRKANLIIESLRALVVCSPHQAAFAGMRRWRWMTEMAESYEDLGEVIDSSDDQGAALDMVCKVTGLTPQKMVEDIDHIGYSSEELQNMRALIVDNY